MRLTGFDCGACSSQVMKMYILQAHIRSGSPESAVDGSFCPWLAVRIGKNEYRLARYLSKNRLKVGSMWYFCLPVISRAFGWLKRGIAAFDV